MKSLILFTIVVHFSLIIHAQKSESISIGRKETIFSKVLNENRKLWIYTPDNTASGSNAGKRYPVLYLLDGGAHFFSTVGIVQQLSQANGNGVLPEMIIVGIEHTDRLKELTPALPPVKDLDKANPFLHFLSSELIPYMDKHYNTAPYRVLAGHSLGGLTAVDILTHFPQLFNAYIAIDPSMWYNKESYLNQTIARMPKQQLKGTRLFIGVANTMPQGMTLAGLQKDRSEETRHIRSIFRLGNFLKTNATGLTYALKYYEKERHNTVPLLTEYDGLRFIFDYYHFDATEKDFADSTSLIASRLKKHYGKISKELGYKVAAPEALINYFGYDALGQKQFGKAAAMFQLNIENYPNSHQAYDSYADYFSAIKDTLNAIANYEMALKISNEALTQRKLNALTGQQSYNPGSEALKKYAGVYILETYKISIMLEIRDGKLWSKVPGQADSELVPISDNVFTVREKQGYLITFKMDGDQPIEFISVQPNGTFKAVFKKN